MFVLCAIHENKKSIDRARSYETTALNINTLHRLSSTPSHENISQSPIHPSTTPAFAASHASHPKLDSEHVYEHLNAGLRMAQSEEEGP